MQGGHRLAPASGAFQHGDQFLLHPHHVFAVVHPLGDRNRLADPGQPLVHPPQPRRGDPDIGQRDRQAALLVQPPRQRFGATGVIKCALGVAAVQEVVGEVRLGEHLHFGQRGIAARHLQRGHERVALGFARALQRLHVTKIQVGVAQLVAMADPLCQRNRLVDLGLRAGEVAEAGVVQRQGHQQLHPRRIIASGFRGAQSRHRIGHRPGEFPRQSVGTGADRAEVDNQIRGRGAAHDRLGLVQQLQRGCRTLAGQFPLALQHLGLRGARTTALLLAERGQRRPRGLQFPRVVGRRSEDAQCGVVSAPRLHRRGGTGTIGSSLKTPDHRQGIDITAGAQVGQDVFGTVMRLLRPGSGLRHRMQLGLRPG